MSLNNNPIPFPNMKKQIIALILFTAAAKLAAADSNIYSVQPEFPQIIRQPEDQLVPMNSTATFSVVATNGPLAYQWFRNGNAVDGQTNDTLTISNAQISDVALYSCNVFKDTESVPTRAASLMVFTSSIDPQTGVDPVTVYASAVASSGSSGTCPGPYTGYVNYTKTAQQGWGWAPDTTGGNTIFTATDTNRTNTKIQYFGAYGDNSCNQTTVTVPNPPISPVYRFSIYFTNNVPTNAYAITLNGFKP
jgi:hypothetical protein